MKIIKGGWWDWHYQSNQDSRFVIGVESGGNVSTPHEVTLVTPGFEDEPKDDQFTLARTESGQPILVPGVDQTPRLLMLSAELGPHRGRIRVACELCTARILMHKAAITPVDCRCVYVAVAKPGDCVIIEVTDKKGARKFLSRVWKGAEIEGATSRVWLPLEGAVIC